MMTSNIYKTVSERSVEVPIKDLKKGMTIDKDIIVDNKNMLIKKGYVIKNQFALEKVQQLLERYNIETVGIIVKEIEEKKVEYAELFPKITNDDLGKANKLTKNHRITQTDKQEVSYSKVLKITNKKEAEVIDKLIPLSKKNITEKMILLFNGADASEVESIEEDIKRSMEVIKTSVNVLQLLEKVKRVDDSLFFYNYSVALTSYMIGKWMGWGWQKREELFITAILADIGILQLPEDKTNRDNWEQGTLNEYYKHVIYSQRLLTKCSFITKNMLNSILHHHEKYDGSGYPRNLKGKQIPVLSRIIYLADLYSFYTLKKKYNPLYSLNFIKEEHLHEVDIDLFFTFSKRIFDYLTGQAFRSNGSTPMEGEIITFDNGTGNSVYDQSNINVYIKQNDKPVIAMPLNSFCEHNIEFI